MTTVYNTIVGDFECTVFTKDEYFIAIELYSNVIWATINNCPGFLIGAAYTDLIFIGAIKQ